MPVKSKIQFIGGYDKIITAPNLYYHRFTTIHRFKQMVKSKSIWFANPEAGWNDPYERYYLQSQYKTSTGKRYLPARGRMFGWCLSTRYNSEAYWQVYAPLKDGVRLRINATKLAKHLNTISNAQVFVGRVEYLNSKQFSNQPRQLKDLRKEIESDVVGENQIKLMLKKRTAFLYEEELRIFAVTPAKQNIYTAPVDIMSITDEIHLDPRMDKSAVDFYKNELSEYYKIPINKIGRSILFQPPKSKVFETAK